MNARQIATGTLLAASLTIGSGAAVSAQSRPAMDRFEVPCDRMERRLDHLQQQQGVLEARRARLELALDTAQTDGDRRRIRRLRVQLQQVDRAAERLEAAVAKLSERHDTHCEPETIS